MKFMLNGALTLCTLDGANVEIAELVGDENIYTFGASSKQVEQLYADGTYDAGVLYRKPGIKLLVDFITNPAFMATGNAERLQRLHDDIKGKDWFMALLDIEEYIQTKERVLADYEDQDAWMRKALINIANAGTFVRPHHLPVQRRDLAPELISLPLPILLRNGVVATRLRFLCPYVTL